MESMDISLAEVHWIAAKIKYTKKLLDQLNHLIFYSPQKSWSHEIALQTAIAQVHTDDL